MPVHVFDRDHVPMFVSSSQDQAVLADDFAARHLGSSVSRTERPRLRVGDPVEAILAAIRRDEADAVVVCWSQHLGTGRAAVIRALLTHGGVPVILQPLDAGRSATTRGQAEGSLSCSSSRMTVRSCSIASSEGHLERRVQGHLHSSSSSTTGRSPSVGTVGR